MDDSPPRHQRPQLHNFNLPNDLKWERTRSQRSDVNRRHTRHGHSRLHKRSGLPASSSSSSDSRWLQQQISESCTDVVLPQSAPAVHEWPKWIGDNPVAQDNHILKRCPLPSGEETLYRESEGSKTHTPSRTSSHHRQSSGETLHRDGGYVSCKSPIPSRISSHRSSREISRVHSSWSSKSFYQSSGGSSRPTRVPSQGHQSSRRTAPRDGGGSSSRSYGPSRETSSRDAGEISRSSRLSSAGEAHVKSSSKIFKSPPPLSGDASISVAEKPPDLHMKISRSSGASSQMWSSHDSRHYASQTLNHRSDYDEDDNNKTNTVSKKVSFKPSDEMPIKKRHKAFSSVKMDGKDDDGEDEFAKEKYIYEIMKEKMDWEDHEGKKYKREDMSIKTYVCCSKKEGGQSNEEKKPETMLLPMKKRRDGLKYKPIDEDEDANDLDAKFLNLRDTKPIHSNLYHGLNLDENNTTPSAKDKWEYLKEQNYKQIAGMEGEEHKNSGNKRNSDQVINKDEEHNKKNGADVEIDKDEGQNKKNDADVEKKKDDEKKKEEGKGKGKKTLKKRKNDQPDVEEEEIKELKIPKVNAQLAPDKIAEDLFVLGNGSRPQRKHSYSRTPRVQRDIDQVTPGMCLEDIEMDHYKVSSKSSSKNHKNSSKNNKNNKKERY
ncbi:OLC1v1038580C1 [Oldenlandia corymbosa var. corymbosa]|uniref:OLC1v1038580C1 n=1 Tax=Oldenlandia corymbosa var. corymbosa TaxID=529605 RepID=A0AAV1D167_OLDCO|nr:OLC1v1038580C1 [Oldenlandia corymbosa var. corymbosa]